MNWNQILPVLIVFIPFFTGFLIFFIPEKSAKLRIIFNLSGASLSFFLNAIIIFGVLNNEVYDWRCTLVPGIDLLLEADTLAVYFAPLSSGLWFLTSLYAIGYLEGDPNCRRFFGFFSWCISATMGVALAGNLVTFFLFYEILTLTTYPLVIHRETPQAIQSGRIYLLYTCVGGLLFLSGAAWLRALIGPLDFTSGGILGQMGPEHHNTLIIIFFLLICGVGVKAALFPFHGWLPKAMVAPAPVSALLHAVAVVKAGAFGIIRIVYEVFGAQFCMKLGVLNILAGMAAFTIIYGSLQAMRQDDLKKRLAYSTISQVSYIALGISISSPISAIGGMVHLVHQGLMKITLFFCAGNLAEKFDIHKVSEMKGIGRQMPLTLTAFTLGVFGMIGIPPMAGFFSKWYLGLGGISVGKYWVVGVLIVSSLLNAIYFLPTVYTAWFEKPNKPFEKTNKKETLEIHWMLLIPPVITAILALLAGLLANAPFSPLAWTKLIIQREYGL